MPRINDKSWRDERKAEAKTRRANRDACTPQQQLQKLDQRLGVNVGAAKERARLTKLLTKTKRQEQTAAETLLTEIFEAK